jgi:hypothetical protein
MDHHLGEVFVRIGLLCFQATQPRRSIPMAHSLPTGRRTMIVNLRNGHDTIEIDSDQLEHLLNYTAQLPCLARPIAAKQFAIEEAETEVAQAP